MTRYPGMHHDEAASWVARMDSGRWSDALEAELQAWLAADPDREGALLRSQAAWLSLDTDAAVEDAPAERPWSLWHRRSVLAGAGSAVAASLVGGLFWLNAATSYQTKLGEIRRVPLKDGSIIAINSASDLEVRYEARQRLVRLSVGEAWFQVAKNPKRPFLVEAGRVKVEAVGTAFSVRRWQNGAEILVTDGVVEAWVVDADGHKVSLTAGQRAFVANNAAIRMEDSSPSSVDRALAWRGGMINLAGETLGQAVEEFNRYNARKLVVADPALASEQFDGVFRVDDPEGFARAVRAALGVPLELSDPERIRIGGRQR